MTDHRTHIKPPTWRDLVTARLTLALASTRWVRAIVEAETDIVQARLDEAHQANLDLVAELDALESALDELTDEGLAEAVTRWESDHEEGQR